MTDLSLSTPLSDPQPPTLTLGDFSIEAPPGGGGIFVRSPQLAQARFIEGQPPLTDVIDVATKMAQSSTLDPVLDLPATVPAPEPTPVAEPDAGTIAVDPAAWPTPVAEPDAGTIADALAATPPPVPPVAMPSPDAGYRLTPDNVSADPAVNPASDPLAEVATAIGDAAGIEHDRRRPGYVVRDALGQLVAMLAGIADLARQLAEHVDDAVHMLTEAQQS